MGRPQLAALVAASADDRCDPLLPQLDAQRRASEITLRRAVITAAEIDRLPSSAATYRNLGKAYVLTPRADVMKWLEETAGRADKDIKGAGERKAGLEAKLQRTDKEIKEVLGVAKA